MTLSGREVLPLVEGGKGIGVSDGVSAGAWAAAGGVGTFSGVNADSLDDSGHRLDMVYRGRTRQERHQELIAYGIVGGIHQAQVAHETAGGQGRIHMNVLWEMGGAEPVLHGVLEGTQGLIHGITCGAGMPYRVATIAQQYGVYYYPIVSSARAFSALWKRAYAKVPDLLGGVVYEDPWRAGGHNGLSNTEDPLQPEAPYDRVRLLRDAMTRVGLAEVPIFMAGGVWALNEWADWIDNPELGPIAFQFGTRPLLTRESPIPQAWKERLPTLKKGDVWLHRFSPTGFYSSAVANAFLLDLAAREKRQIPYATAPEGTLDTPLAVGQRGRTVYVTAAGAEAARDWMAEGFRDALRTPDHTLVFVTPEQTEEITRHQAECMGCLSACRFSNWAQGAEGTTGKRPDPRSFCIQKTLQAIAHTDDVEHQLMFAGHNVYRFGEDPFYANGSIPTVRELIDRLLTGQ